VQNEKLDLLVNHLLTLRAEDRRKMNEELWSVRHELAQAQGDLSAVKAENERLGDLLQKTTERMKKVHGRIQEDLDDLHDGLEEVHAAHNSNLNMIMAERFDHAETVRRLRHLNTKIKSMRLPSTDNESVFSQ
jgi:predicted  nucleic acid-binding Zn-ribbon protein